MIYAFLSQKGGVGKTTLSIHLADALARRGSRVLLIDADPQQSAMKWSTFRAGENKFSVIAMAKPTLHKELTPDLCRLHRHRLIDGPPRFHELAKSIILAADLVLVPVQPSPPDVWATAETVDLVNEARVFKETLKSAIAINRKIVNTVIGRDVREALLTLNTPILQSDISQRIAFAEAFADGKTVSDLDPHSHAAHEVEALVTELVRNYEQKDRHERTTARSGRHKLTNGSTKRRHRTPDPPSA